MKRLRIPVALSVVAVTTSSVALAQSCGGGQSPPTADANCVVHCVPSGSDDTNCPFPTCATGGNLDECPAGCIPEPIV